MKFTITLAAAALSLGSGAYAGAAVTCPTTNVCYSLVIPDSTATSGSGDIYFQLTAPTTYSWVALGQGTQMIGSNIFVMYTSSDGKNVTLSPRLATGHVMPQHDTSAEVTLLAGSGVSNGTMVANVQCRNCNSWASGSMDSTASSADWVFAYKSGSAINSDDPTATIQYHDEAAPFAWNIAAAKGSNTDLNPFVLSAAASSPSSTSASPSSSPSSSTSSATYYEPFGGDFAKAHRAIIAHGVLACLAWVVLFPSGAIVVRLAKFKHLVWVHAAIQGLGFVFFTAAVGLGIYFATNVNYLTQAHPIIGLTLFGVLGLQSMSGLIHHYIYHKRPGSRNVASWLHLGIGRPAVILGIINGGLGIQLAAMGGHPVDYAYIVTFAVFAGIMGTAYLVAIGVGEWQRSKARAAQRNGSSDGTVRSDEERVGREKLSAEGVES